MARIVAGIGTSHVPSIGGAYDRGKTGTPAWKPLFDAYVPVRAWLQAQRPDIVVMVYNDHGADFFFDKYPTVAVGCADQYPIADEGFGQRPLPAVPGDLAFSQHLCRSLVDDEFDIAVCQKMRVEHGFLVPMHLCFEPSDHWPLAAVPVAVNVLQHPLPTARRCLRLGETEGSKSESNLDFLRRIEEDPLSLTEWNHRTWMERFGVEGIELIMWLVMRGALSQQVRCIHRNYYAPMTTGMGLITFEEQP